MLTDHKIVGDGMEKYRFWAWKIVFLLFINKDFRIRY